MSLQQHRSPLPADWYVITDDGLSSLRISHGLRVGETDAGALALNDPDPENCWLEFEFGEQPSPAIRLLRDQYVLLLEGKPLAGSYPLSYGVVLQLPHNELYLAPEIGAARRPGLMLRIEPATGSGIDAPEVTISEPRQPEPGAEVAAAAATKAPDEPDPPSRKAFGMLFVPGHRKAVLGSSINDVAEPARRAASEPVVQAPAAVRVPVLTSKPQPRPRRLRARRTRGERARLLALLMVVLGVSAAVVQYPAGIRLEKNPGEILTARLVTGAQPALAPSTPTIEEPGSASADPTDTPVPADENSGSAAALEENPGAAPAADVEPARAAADAEPAMPPANPPDPRPAATSPAATSSAADDWRLIRARRLLAQGSITYPPEANAVALALDLLGEQPGHPEALAVLGEATNQLLSRALQAHERGQAFQARNTLEEIFAFNPDNARARRLWREWVGRER